MKKFEEKIDLGTSEQKDGEEIKEQEEEQDYGEEIFGTIQEKIKNSYLDQEVRFNRKDIQRDEGSYRYRQAQKGLKETKEGWETIIKKIKVIENFKQENPEIYKIFLEEIKKNFVTSEDDFKIRDEIYNIGFRSSQLDSLIPNKKIDKELKHFFTLESLVKIEIMNPPKGIKEIVGEEIKKNKWIKFSDIEDFIDINPSEEDIKVLKRLNELNIGGLCDFSQKQLIEKKDKIYHVLLNDEKFSLFASQFNQLKEICERKPTTPLLEDVRVIVEGEAEEQGLFSKETQDVLKKIATPEIEEMLDDKERKEFVKKELNHYETYQEIIRCANPPELLEKFFKNEIKKTNSIYEKYGRGSFDIVRTVKILQKRLKNRQKNFRKYLKNIILR